MALCTGGEHDRVWKLGPVGVHDPGPGLQGNHHWLVLHQCVHLYQQLCSKCKEGKPRDLGPLHVHSARPVVQLCQSAHCKGEMLSWDCFALQLDAVVGLFCMAQSRSSTELSIPFNTLQSLHQVVPRTCH